MIVKLHTQRLQTLDEIRAFLAGSHTAGLRRPRPEGSLPLDRGLAAPASLRRLGKADKGLVRAYLVKVSGFSRAQLTRLIGQFRRPATCAIAAPPPANAFRRRYLAEDVACSPRSMPCTARSRGPATRKLCERACEVFGDDPLRAPGRRSPTVTLYNLRHSTGYQRLRTQVDKTRPTAIRIGERRKPFPDRPPWLPARRHRPPGRSRRHQGALPHQRRSTKSPSCRSSSASSASASTSCCPSSASPARRLPLRHPRLPQRQRLGVHQPRVAGLLRQAPHRVHQVALAPHQRQRPGREQERLGRPQAPRLRPHPRALRAQVNDFAVGVLSPYLNFHRPCLFPEEVIDAKGKRRKRYPYANLITPYEKLKSLPDAAQTPQARHHLRAPG